MGCRTILVKTGFGDVTLKSNTDLTGVIVHDNLLSFVKKTIS